MLYNAEHMAESDPPSQPIFDEPPDAQADARCIAAVLSGQPQRFVELIERHQQAVFAVARAYIKDAHLAEDVAQDVFLKAYTSLAALQQPELFHSWLLQIARHHAAQARARQVRRPDQPGLSAAESAAPAQRTDDDRLGRVLAGVEELPEPYRSTVLQKYQAGLSCKEIAEREGVAVGTITSRLTRALAMLRNALVARPD